MDLKKVTRYVDAPAVAETFADTIENILVDGSVFRIEFSVCRLDELEPPKGRRHPACRLILTNEAAVDLFNKMSQAMEAMKTKGLVKKNPPNPGSSSTVQ